MIPRWPCDDVLLDASTSLNLIDDSLSARQSTRDVERLQLGPRQLVLPTNELANRGQDLRRKIRCWAQNHPAHEKGQRGLKHMPKTEQKHRERHRVVLDLVHEVRQRYRVRRTSHNQIRLPAIVDCHPTRRISDQPCRRLIGTTLRPRCAMRRGP